MKKLLLFLSTVMFGFSLNAYANSFAARLYLAPNQTVTQKLNYPIKNYVNVADNELDLSSSGVQDSDIPKIVTYLINHPQITSLNLEDNFDLSSSAIALLASVNTLTSLNLARSFNPCVNRICSGGLEAKDVAVFVENTSLTDLNLFMNNLGDEGTVILANNKRLKKLDLSANNVTDTGGLALAQNKSLQNLALNGNEGITNKTALALADNKSLRYLELAQTRVDDEGAIALVSRLELMHLSLADDNITDKSAQAFSKNESLVHLNLAGNHMTAKGAVLIAKLQNLRSLDFSGDFFGQPRPNDIGDEGAIAIGKMKLRTLDLSSQQITSVGAMALGKISGLANLYLNSNEKIGDEGIKGLLARNTIWRVLDLSGCSITDRGAKKLAEGNYEILLSLRSNYISDSGASALAKTKTLSLLDLTANQVGDEGAFALAESRIHYLLIGENHISAIGIAALEQHNFEYLETGVQYPAVLHSKSGKIPVHGMRKYI